MKIDIKRVAAIVAVVLIAGVSTSVNAQEKKYRGYFETGYSWGEGDYGFDQWIVTTMHGVCFKDDKLFVGGGVSVGMEMGDNAFKTNTIPLFVASRYTFRDCKLQPFIDARIGYQFILEDEIGGGYCRGGLYMAPGVGVTFPGKRRGPKDYSVRVGYTLKRTTYHWKNNYTDELISKKRYNAGGIYVTAGLSW